MKRFGSTMLTDRVRSERFGLWECGFIIEAPSVGFGQCRV